MEEKTNKYYGLDLCDVEDDRGTNKTRACFNSCPKNTQQYIWHVGKWTEVSKFVNNFLNCLNDFRQILFKYITEMYAKI